MYLVDVFSIFKGLFLFSHILDLRLCGNWAVASFCGRLTLNAGGFYNKEILFLNAFRYSSLTSYLQALHFKIRN